MTIEPGDSRVLVAIRVVVDYEAALLEADRDLPDPKDAYPGRPVAAALLRAYAPKGEIAGARVESAIVRRDPQGDLEVAIAFTVTDRDALRAAAAALADVGSRRFAASGRAATSANALGLLATPATRILSSEAGWLDASPRRDALDAEEAPARSAAAADSPLTLAAMRATVAAVVATGGDHAQMSGRMAAADATAAFAALRADRFKVIGRERGEDVDVIVSWSNVAVRATPPAADGQVVEAKLDDDDEWGRWYGTDDPDEAGIASAGIASWRLPPDGTTT